MQFNLPLIQMQFVLKQIIGWEGVLFHPVLILEEILRGRELMPST